MGLSGKATVPESLAETPIDPAVTAQSIIAVRGDLPPDEQSDGVVRFDSAHLDGVASEFVVSRSEHSVQRSPIAIEEVRRILVAHADQVCRTNHVACEPQP